MSQISIWPLRKTLLGDKTLVGNHRGQTFLVVVHQVCTHLRRDFVPLLFADPLQVIKVSRLTFGTRTFSSLHRFSMGLRSGDWLGHSRTLMCFFWATPLLPWPCVLGHCHAGIQIHDPFSLPWQASMPWPWWYMSPVHRPFDAVQLSCPLSRKPPPKHNVSTSMFDSGYGVLGVIGSIPPPPNTASFTQFSSESFRCSLANFRRACTCAFLSRGPCGRCRISVLHGVVLPIVFLVTMVSAALRSLTRSSHVVLGWFVTVLMIIETPRGEILHGAPDRGRSTVILCFFHLRIITPTVVTFSPSCLAMVL